MIAAVGIATAIFTSCNNTSTVGSDLVSDEVAIVVDSSFTLSARSVQSDAVLSRTTVQLLGLIDVPEYGAIRSDFVTQFMPSDVMDTTGVTVNEIDSLKLVMLVNQTSFTGDSLALMGLDVYPLTKQLSAPIYSNFDPAGYYDPNGRIGSAVYNLSKASEPDSLKTRTYYSIFVDLPLELGRKFFQEYRTNPATFATPSAFARFFPGLYVANSYGSGRISRIGNTSMRLYYHRNTKTEAGNDTTIHYVGSYFAVTPEIVTNNDISLDVSSNITTAISQGDAIMLAPAGYNVELTFPGREIAAAYRQGIKDGLGVVNKLSFRLPVADIDNKYGIGAPDDVLLVLKKDYEKFFIENNLPDNTTSFQASLTQLDDGTTAYVFPDMRQYIVNLLAKETITDDDVSFMLVPVYISYETNSNYGGVTTMTAISPYVLEPKMGRILVDRAKINFIYSLQTTNF